MKDNYYNMIVELLKNADETKLRHLWHFVKVYLSDN